MIKNLLILILTVQLSLGAYTEFYTQTTGNNLNAGSTTDDAAELTSTGGGWDSATGVFTCAGATDLSGVAVGEWASVYNDGATEAVFVARITAVDDGADTITVSTTAKSGTAPTTSTANDRSIKVGGAWDGPTGSSAFPWTLVQSTMTDSSGNPVRVNFKSGTAYEITAAGTQPAANTGPIFWEGYTTSVGDGGIAIFDGANVASGTPFVMMTIDGDGQIMKSLWFRNNYLAPQAGAQATGNFILDMSSRGHYLYRVKVSGGYRGGIRIDGASTASGTVVEECEFFNNNYDDANLFGNCDVDEESTFIRTLFYGGGNVMRAGATGTQAAGCDIATALGEHPVFIECIFADNQGDGVFFSTSTGSGSFYNCTFARNGLSLTGDGADLSSVSQTAQNVIQFRNCIFDDNDDYGIRNDAQAPGYPFVTNCGFYSNASGETLNINASFISGSITFTGSPFTDLANGDFRLNNTASAGAAARAASADGFLIDTTEYTSGASTVGYKDLGPVQHQDSGGGGSPVTRVTIGIDN